MLRYLLFFVAILLPATSQASSVLSVMVTNNELQVGEHTDLEVLIFADSTVNAIEGKLLFDKTKLVVENVSDGGSIIPLWIKTPFERDDGELSFSGIVPGGFGDGQFKIFNARLRAVATGTVPISFSDTRLLAHDGKGTSVPVEQGKALLVVSDNDLPKFDEKDQKDNLPPDIFTPQFSRDEDVGGGKWYMTFSTTDELSGVDSYYVREYKYLWQRWLSSWNLAISPYILSDQNRHSYIDIKVRDKVGNERIVTVYPLSFDYYNWWWLLLVLFAGLYIWWKFMFKGKKS